MKIAVDLGERSYDVDVGPGARHGLAALLDERAPDARSVALVTSPSLSGQPWFDFNSARDQHVVLVPEGEAAKSLASYAELVERLGELGLSREDVVVTVGGGAICDLGGFAAASYLRGVAVVHVATSLVAQVDAAIGGKTGVNLAVGKNLVGLFHQPLGVFCDDETLVTLPERERASGYGEIAKCWLLEEGPVDALATTTPARLVERAIALKARLVASDEREGGERALLNYGHTLAHALERASWRHGDELRHGEAVAVGLAFAARLARELGRVDDEVVTVTDETLDFFELAREVPSHYDDDELIEAMTHDKKSRHDLRFVLPGPRGFSVVAGVDERRVRDALARSRGGG